MTIQDVARSEGISERQAQRYCRAPGYKGHVLPATRKGKGFVIEESDYKAWRVSAGFDFLPQPDGAESAPPTSGFVRRRDETQEDPAAPDPEPEGSEPPRPSFAELQRRYFSPDRVGGPITNVHAVGSGTMCSPETCREYMEACAERMKRQLRGYDDED
jgi:hypothetical protein